VEQAYSNNITVWQIDDLEAEVKLTEARKTLEDG